MHISRNDSSAIDFLSSASRLDKKSKLRTTVDRRAVMSKRDKLFRLDLGERFGNRRSERTWTLVVVEAILESDPDLAGHGHHLVDQALRGDKDLRAKQARRLTEGALARYGDVASQHFQAGRDAEGFAVLQKTDTLLCLCSVDADRVPRQLLDAQAAGIAAFGRPRPIQRAMPDAGWKVGKPSTP